MTKIGMNRLHIHRSKVRPVARVDALQVVAFASADAPSRKETMSTNS